MPRGVYERKSSNKNAVGGFQPDTKETDAQIYDKINERFMILEALAQAAIVGDTKSIIVSGPPGLGKSYTIEKELEDFDPSGNTYSIIKGYVRSTGLYKKLYQHRFPGNVLVFDDADTIFFDDTSLNLLKTVCDTTERRVVSYLSEGTLIDEESAERIPKSFEFEGTVIFITNLDFDVYIDRGHKLAPHMKALISRSHYIDLEMKSRRDYIIRIKQVIAKGMLAKQGLNFSEQKDVVDFIENNAENLRELSLRIAIKIGILRKTYPTIWDMMARVTCCKNT